MLAALKAIGSAIYRWFFDADPLLVATEPSLLDQLAADAARAKPKPKSRTRRRKKSASKTVRRTRKASTTKKKRRHS
jgi:hypothetical protein